LTLLPLFFEHLKKHNLPHAESQLSAASAASIDDSNDGGFAEPMDYQMDFGSSQNFQGTSSRPYYRRF
jgi:hypothetical protein